MKAFICRDTEKCEKNWEKIIKLFWLSLKVLKINKK